MSNIVTQIDEWSAKDLEDNSSLKILVEGCSELRNNAKPGIRIKFLGYTINFEPNLVEQWVYKAGKENAREYVLGDSWMVHTDQYIKVSLLTGTPLEVRVEVKTRSSKPVIKEYDPFRFEQVVSLIGYLKFWFMKNKIFSSSWAAWPLLFFLLVFLWQCQPKSTGTDAIKQDSSELKISLAEWSIHRALDSGKLKPENFAAIAKNNFGISAVEYVNSFYKAHAKDEKFWKKMRATADSLGVRSLLIMVDDEGDLGNPDAAARKLAVENHYKWVDAAQILGCHSIRINAFGDGSKDQVQAAMVEALKQLCTYAQKANINVLIENHGLFSSDGRWVAEIMQKVNMPNCGTLPDCGNWCTAVKWGSTEDNKCKEVYDRYKGISEMLPFARGLSAKSYDFNEQGDETIIDYAKILKSAKASNFSGYVGVEYEGHRLSESDGIIATKKLLEKTWAGLNK